MLFKKTPNILNPDLLRVLKEGHGDELKISVVIFMLLISINFNLMNRHTDLWCGVIIIILGVIHLYKTKEEFIDV